MQDALAKMQDVEWDSLRAFCAVAKAGSFAGAAAQLGRHETTIARQIRALEGQVGHVLWRGPDAGITDEGAVVLRHAEVMAQEAAVMQATLRGRDTPAGHVRLTAVPWVIEAGLIPHVPAWREKVPNVTLSVLGEHDSLSLLHGEADIALRLARPEGEGDVIMRKLGDVPFVVEDGGADWVGYVPEMAHVPQAQWSEDAGGTISLRLSDQAAVTRAVQAGLGRGWVPRCLARCVDPNFEPRSRPLWCLTHPRTRHAPAVRAVCDQLLPLVVRTLCG